MVGTMIDGLYGAMDTLTSNVAKISEELRSSSSLSWQVRGDWNTKADIPFINPEQI